MIFAEVGCKHVLKQIENSKNDFYEKNWFTLVLAIDEDVVVVPNKEASVEIIISKFGLKRNN